MSRVGCSVVWMAQGRRDPDPALLSRLLAPPDEGSRRAQVGRGTGASDKPSATRAIARGLTKRCPRCGQRRLFSRWFTLASVCPRCGLEFQREEGGFLGAIALNYAAAVAVWVLMLAVWLIVDLPDIHVAALTVASALVVVATLLFFYPFSKTTWAAVEYLVYRSEMRGP
jgi:uncharacterized protein (DUF983 family)